MKVSPGVVNPNDLHGSSATHHEHHHSASYKAYHFMPFLVGLDMYRKLGRVILDVGSGSMRITDSHGHNRLRAYYPTEGKKIIRVDLAFKKRSQIDAGMLEVQADIENTALNTPEQKKRFLAIAKFLEIDPREKKPHVDTLLLSDVLNYVNYRRAILGLLRFVKPGGRIIIYNRPEHGFSTLYSEKRPRDNATLIRSLKRMGLELDYVHYETPEEAEEIIGIRARRGIQGRGYVPDDKEKRTIIIVARKKAQ